MSTTIRQWLSDLDLLRYARAFEAADLTPEELGGLEETHLRQLGVESIGHRLRILQAAAARHAEAGAPDAGAARASRTPASTTERRRLTVMFCDLVGSTRLSNELDPEDLRDVVRAYQREVTRVVERYGGHVAQLLGDGVMVYFGFPTTHEDAAQSSVHAALALPGAIATLNERLERRHRVSLTLRVGIASGPVVLGRMGRGRDATVLALGPAPNEAARWQTLARGNGVVIGAGTRTLLGNAFRLEPLVPDDADASSVGEAPDAGDARAFRVLGAAATERRFTAAERDGPPVLFGRDEELASLLGAWERAGRGDGGALTLFGEAGIGKSSLVQALLDAIDGTDHHRVVLQCSPFHVDTALHPVVRHLVRATDLESVQDPARRLERLERLLAEAGGCDPDAASLLLALLPAGDARLPPDTPSGGTAKDRRERTLASLVELLLGLSARRPVLLVVEDAHWIDPTTLALLRTTLDRLHDRCVFALLTARPTFEPPWTPCGHVSRRTLHRLGSAAMRDIARRLGADRPLSETVLSDIVERADGVPLHVEELTKAMLESDLLDERGEMADRDGALHGAAVPATLHDSLMARLDRLGSVKAIAQTAACIGREFDLDALRAALPSRPDELDGALLALDEADLVRPRPREPGRFAFKHALVRDAAYESLPRARRRDVHAALLAHCLARDEAPEVLAHHATGAESFERAIEHWREAGGASMERAAFHEAIGHFARAAGCTHRLPDEERWRAVELELVVRQGHASTALNGFAHPRTVAINAEALALLDRVDRTPYRIPVLYAQWVMAYATGRHRAALGHADAMLAEAERRDERAPRVVAHRVLGGTQTMMGRFDEAIGHLLGARDLHDHELDRDMTAQYGTDPLASVDNNLSMCRLCTGDVAAARTLVHRLEALAGRSDHPPTRVYVLAHVAQTAQIARWPERERYVRLANEYVDTHELIAYRGHTLGARAMMLFDLGQLAAARTVMCEALDVIDVTRTFIYTPLLHASHAACLAALGRADEAHARADTAIAMAEANEELWAMPEILRLAALARRGSGARGEDASEALLRRSIELAARQGASLWSLRSGIALARLLAERGRRPLAIEALSDATRDLPRAGTGFEDWREARALARALA